MPLTDTGRNNVLTGGLATFTHLSLHVGDPGTAGTNESTGGAPAYARKAVTWATAASGQRKNTAAITWDLPASTAFYIGFWTAITAGTFLGYAPIGGSPFGVGTAGTDDFITSRSHGLFDDERVLLMNVAAEVLPAGLAEGSTLYFVINATTDMFKVATTSGGTAVDITGAGDLILQKVVPEVFAAQGQVTVAINGLVLDANLV